MSRSIGWLLAGLLMCIAGCGGGADPIKPPDIDAATATDNAFDLFDSNSDGQIAGAELDTTPGIKGALATLDSDGDKAVSKQELSSRLEQLVGSRAGALPASCIVTMSGQPLAEAKVTLQPEPFLEGVVSPASGETDAMGMANLKSDAVRGGMQIGLYRIHISKLQNGKETIPAKYNQQTTLGTEISNASPAVTSTWGLQLKLTR